MKTMTNQNVMTAALDAPNPIATFKRTITFLAIAAACLLGAGHAAIADFKTILSRIPSDANVLVMVDVDKLMSSAMARRELWAGGGSSGNSPRLLPPGTSRMAMAGKMDVARLSSVWEISVMDTERPLGADAIAEAQNGFVDN